MPPSPPISSTAINVDQVLPFRAKKTGVLSNAVFFGKRYLRVTCADLIAKEKFKRLSDVGFYYHFFMTDTFVTPLGEVSASRLSQRP